MKGHLVFFIEHYWLTVDYLSKITDCRTLIRQARRDDSGSHRTDKGLIQLAKGLI